MSMMSLYAVRNPLRVGLASLPVTTTARFSRLHRGAAALHTTPSRPAEDRKHPPSSHARTSSGVKVEYPAEHELPASEPVEGAGRAGKRSLPTLATFSLEGKVGVVTGGARGLGLVMGQGMVVSGADLAIVDLNGKLDSMVESNGIRPG